MINGVKARVKRSIRIDRRVLTDLTAIALTGLISISWFGGGYLIKTGDDTFPFDPAYICSDSLYIWKSQLSTGNIIDPFTIAYFPFYAFLTLLSYIGVSLLFSQMMFYYLSFTLSGLFMYFLVTTLVNQNRSSTGLTSALFYMMNPYSLSVVWSAHYTAYFFTYPMAPLLLGLYIKGINAKRKIKYVMIIGILQLIASPMFDDPSASLVVFLMLLLYFIYYIILRRDRANIIAAVRFSVILVVFILLIDMWWVLPGFCLYKVRYDLAQQNYSSLGVFTGGSLWSNMLNTMRLLGFYFIYEKWYPVSVYAWTQIYFSPTFTFISCLIPILGFASLISKHIDRHTAFFVMLSTFGLFLAKGAAQPLGCVNLWLFQNLPFAILYRTHFVRLGQIIALSYSFLIGVTFSKLWKYIEWTRIRPRPIVQVKNQFNSKASNNCRKTYNSKIQKLLECIIIVSILLTAIMLFFVYNYPFWTGDVIYPGSQYLPSARVQVPSYYIDAGNYINAQPEEFRILDIPPRLSGTSAYSWENGYIASDPIDQYYFHKPLVGISLISTIDNKVFNMISHNQSFDLLVDLLNLMDIKYILIHKDWNSGLIRWYSLPPEVTTEILNKESVYLEKSFGKLDLYKNRYWKPLHLYATPNAVLVQGGLDEMIKIIRKNNLTPGQSVLFLSDQLSPQQLRSLSIECYNLSSNQSISLMYEKVNPTKYVVHINAYQPFFLVFSESYNKDWIAYVNGEQLSDDLHFTANGYANAWYINKTGIYTITIEFWPQKLFYIGFVISITTFILCLSYISKDKIFKINKKSATNID